MRKLKVLFVSEAGYTLSGYGVYYKEIVSRLFATNKYEIAELASFGYVNDERDSFIKWRFYPNAVGPNDPRHGDQNTPGTYKYHPENEFGAWRFERVLIDFKPDVVIDVRDPWMFMFQNRSQLRKYFHWVIMPTVDSAPQQEEWLDHFAQADAVFTYSDWGLEILRKQGGGLIKLQQSAPPGVHLEEFYPVINKLEHKRSMGFDPKLNIVGTVMRNQRRKLFPDLLEAFNIFLKKCKDAGAHELASNSYLYFHTSYPDSVGCWNIPRIIKEQGLTHKVLFTYICKECQAIFATCFQDARTLCPRCKHISAILPAVGGGLTTEQLKNVYNLFDVYVQYATCLGEDELVLTEDGWQHMRTIKAGDKVWTHKGRWQPVAKVFNNLPNPNGVCKKITLHSDYDALEVITDNHPVYGYFQNGWKGKDKKRSLREQLGERINRNGPIPQMEFKPVSELRAGDLIAAHIDDTVEDVTRIDLKDFYNDSCIDNGDTFDIRGGDAGYNRYIDVDNDFCRFLGLYAADGSISINDCGVMITQHTNEQQATLINQIYSRFHCEYEPVTRLYNNRQGIDYLYHGKIHHNYFEITCGKKATKRLPKWTDKLPLDKQREILIGLCMGDGCYSNDVHNNSERNTTIFVTTSAILAEQVKNILWRLRISFNAHMDIRGGNRQPQFRFEIPSNIQAGDIISKRKNTRSLYIGNYILRQVKSVEEINYTKNTYNLEVKTDNSYTTKVGLVHNCEGFGMPQVEAAACGVPVMSTDYSAMSDVVRKLHGFPIKVARMYRAVEEDANKAYPCNEDLAQKLFNYLSLPLAQRQHRGAQARAAVEKHYVWDKTAKIWENYLDNLELTGLQGKWDSPQIPTFTPQPMSAAPPNLSNDQFVEWCIMNVLGDPTYLNSVMAMDIARALNYELMIGVNHAPMPFPRERAWEKLNSMALARNAYEHARCNEHLLPPEDYIQYAHMKGNQR